MAGWDIGSLIFKLNFLVFQVMLVDMTETGEGNRQTYHIIFSFLRGRDVSQLQQTKKAHGAIWQIMFNWSPHFKGLYHCLRLNHTSIYTISFQKQLRAKQFHKVITSGRQINFSNMH